jgi:hypothetical protein
MPISSSDLLLKHSIKTGTAGNQNAQANPNASLGKYISTTQITDATLDNLFDDISGDDNSSGTVDYRCVFIHNAHGSLTLQGPRVWIGGSRCTVTAVDDTFTCTSHGFADGEAVRLEAEYASDTLPVGVDNATTYYVRNSAANTFKLAASVGGAAVNVTADGTATVRRYGNTAVAIAIDNQGASVIGSGSAQADQVATELVAPSTVGPFSGPLTKSAGLVLGSLPPGQCRAVWVRRTPLNAGARSLDGVVLRVEGDTAA